MFEASLGMSLLVVACGSGGRGFRVVGLSEQERGDAIAGMTADDAAFIDDALISSSHEATTELKVLRGRKPSRERRRPFEIGDQDRRRPPIRRFH